MVGPTVTSFWGLIVGRWALTSVGAIVCWIAIACPVEITGARGVACASAWSGETVTATRAPIVVARPVAVAVCVVCVIDAETLATIVDC